MSRRGVAPAAMAVLAVFAPSKRVRSRSSGAFVAQLPELTGRIYTLKPAA